MKKVTPKPVFFKILFWFLSINLSRFQIRNKKHLIFLWTLVPNSCFCHISLISYPNHSPQSPNFIFFHSLSFEPIEISNNSFKWRNHQRSERVLWVKANGIPRLRKRKFLPPFPLPPFQTSINFCVCLLLPYTLLFSVVDENPETGQIQAKGPSGEGQSPRVEKEEGPEAETLSRLLIVAEGQD